MGTEHANVLIATPATQVTGEIGDSGTLESVLDTEELKQTLRESEQRFRKMIDALPTAIYTTDAQGRLTHFNPACVEFSGRTPKLGSDHWCVTWKLFYPDGRPMPHDECPMAIALKTGEIVRGAEAIAERPDGTRIWFMPYPTPLFDDAGNVIGGINMLVDITERKTAEAAGAYLAAIVQSSDDAIITKSLDGVITTWNASAERLFGYTAQEAIGKPITMLIPADRQHEEPRIIEQLRRGERVNHFETKRLRKDGSLLDISLTISPVRDSDGRIVGASKVARDISERCRADEALRSAQGQLEAELADARLLAEVSAALAREENVQDIYEKIIDAAIGIMRADFASMQMLYPERGDQGELRLLAFRGFNPQAAKFWEWVRTDSKCTCGIALANGRRCIEPDIANSRMMAGTPDQATYLQAGIHAVQSTPLLSRSGKLVGIISTHWKQPRLAGEPAERELRLLDVLARQAADLIDRKKAEQDLRESEERFRMLADNIAQLAWTCDKLGNVTWYNKRWLEYTGLSFEEMKGWGWTKCHHPEHVDRVVASVTQLRETGEIWEETFPLRGIDGQYRWFLSRAVPIRDSDGNILRWFGTNTDVTEQLAAEAALREADRRKDEFLAMLAHELRNPLAPMRNAVQILRLAGADETIRSVSETMERQVNQLVRMVDDLLDVNRISRGKIELRTSRVELASIVYQAVEAVRPTCETSGHDLSVTLPEHSIYLDGDPARLAQVLSNLLNNACKFTNNGGRITLTAEQQAEHVVIRVRDNGIGIAADQLPRIFNIFTQVDTSLERSASGLGIGLTLVKNLVEMHGGTVEAHSQGIGQGSEFVVRLPVSRGQPELHPPVSTRSQASATVPRRILVVDDNRDSAKTMAMLLKVTGHQTHIAFDGLEALAAAESFRPEVVLLDIGLPKLNGYETAITIRAQPWGKDMLLVALTGWGQDDDREKSKNAGFDAHLVKPVDYAVLTKLLADSRPQPA